MSRVSSVWSLVTVAAISSPLLAEVTFLEPAPYLSVDDSPFDMSGLGTAFFFEDFEDGVFDLPNGVEVFPGDVRGPDPFTDSVDGDDGLIDGSGNAGHSFMPTFTIVGPSNPPNWWTSFQLGFDEAELGFLPRSVGLVWSDGFPGSLLILTVYERGRVESWRQYTDLMDIQNTGQTSEDRFIGVTSDVGIEFFSVTHLYVGNVFVNHFEVDHIQYGSVPEPCELTLGCFACLVLLGSRPLSSQGVTRNDQRHPVYKAQEDGQIGR